MRFAVFHQPIVTIYDRMAETKETDEGIHSAISDEGLYGMPCRVLTEENDWAYVMTHYGYAGYVYKKDLLFMTEERLKEYLAGRLAVVDAICLDVLGTPQVQGVCLQSLVGGCLVEMVPEAQRKEADVQKTEGWTQVRLLDGRMGYMRTDRLGEKRYGEEYLWMDPEEILGKLAVVKENALTAQGGCRDFCLQELLDRFYGGDEELFRDQLVAEAMKYLGVQYRWGGKSAKGIDCSGLVSTAYMRSGVLIYRDASIVNGYNMVRQDREASLTGEIKKGDALYFPGHIAMYIGDGKYIHSAGSSGVVINSLRSSDPEFRQNLRDDLYAVGGVRV